MSPTTSLALAVLTLIGLVALLVFAAKGDTFPTKGTALIFIGALIVAAASETTVLAATL